MQCGTAQKIKKNKQNKRKQKLQLVNLSLFPSQMKKTEKKI